MKTCIGRASLIAAVLLSSLEPARAASPTFWQVGTRAEFLSGEVEDLSIDSDGRLVLGPATDLVYESSAPFLWAVIPGPDGTLWVGSGNEGRVFGIDRQGQGTIFFDAPELEAHALALAPDGSLYVGTSPDGKIYKVGRDGSSSVFFDPEEKYIWSLVVDRAGNLFAGTGDKGVIYRIRPDGTGEPFYRTNTTHAISLALDRAGNLLAGTESPGRVFRIDSEARPFVLLESAFREIRSIRVDETGNIYAAAVSARPGVEERPADRPAPEPARPVPSVSTEITSISIADITVPSGAGPAPTPRREDRRAPKGAVYRIAPDGLWDVIWESSEDSPYDLTFDADGLVLIATGDRGKIYRIDREPTQTTLLMRAPARHVTRFLRTADGHNYYITANPGKILRIADRQVARGIYESPVRDATTVATWGTIRWRAAASPGHVQLFTRSGNTATPDETWSDWAGPYTDAEGEQIGSPNARYLQWRVVMTGGSGNSPVLTSVTAAYLQRNLRPRVVSITVHPPGTVFQKPFTAGEPEIAGYDDGMASGRPPVLAVGSPGTGQAGGPPPAPALGRRMYQKGLQTFVWKAEDDNNDTLQYDIFYRREGETAWKVLKEDLWDPIFVWDTTSVPDGTYMIKVVASDAPSNSPAAALEGEMESTTFDVDNTPPRIELQPIRRERGRVTIPFVVRDEQSPVSRVEYSLDGSRWRVVYPLDGIPDSRVEEFELQVDEEASQKSVIIRATDAMDNSTTAVAETAPARRTR
jgi:sugar lactone lactonase YvrE